MDNSHISNSIPVHIDPECQKEDAEISQTCSGRVCKEEFQKKNLTLDYEHPFHFVTAQCFNPTVYRVWVMFWAFYHLIIMVLQPTSLLDVKTTSPRWLIFLTNWGYMMLALYSFTDCVTTLYVHIHRKDILNNHCTSMPWYLKFVWVLFNVSTITAVNITVMFYTLLSPDTNANSLIKHAVNSVYAILNVFICAKPFRLLHVFHSILFATIYTVFTIVYQSISDDVVYEILNWTSLPRAPLLALGVLVIVIPLLHVVLFAFYHLRLYLYSKCHDKMSRNITTTDT